MSSTRHHIGLFTALSGVLMVAASWAEAPRIVQPGAPGQATRVITTDAAVQLAATRFIAADVQFMRDMVPHHQQALDMSVLVPDRTQSPELLALSQRILATQADEIELMTQWLQARGEPAPDRDWRLHVHDHAHDHAHDHGYDNPDHDQVAGKHERHHHHRHQHHIEPAAESTGHTMEGMATVAQMMALEASQGESFDRQFLALMIEHHRGALVMVDDLLSQAGSAQDPELFEFVSDIKNDQQAEIDQMVSMLNTYFVDPRVGLGAGLYEAEEAIWHLSLVHSQPKPEGFYDPENPAALPPGDDAEGGATRRPLLDFANTDLAFSGSLMAVGNYHGFKLYDLTNPAEPELISGVVCPGGQGDVSIVGDLLLMSVEQNRGRTDCGTQGVPDRVSEERFRGIRIFDISDVSTPVQVGQVQTCRGSHTHTVVTGPEPDGRIIVYNSGIAPVRDGEELEGCSDESPWRDQGTSLYRIDVIEIPVDRPDQARVVHSPAVFSDPNTGVLAGLWERGDHGPRTQVSSETNHCHDITVFPELQIAAGACAGNGILFDISDPINPTRIDSVVDPGFAYWHSATFSNDGSTVLFTDEWGGGTRPRCRVFDPLNWGANAIYDIVDGQLQFRSYYKMPAPQTETENCVAHNGSLIPVPGRDIFVQSWYQGGISVFDFTDSAAPFEIAFFDRGPVHADQLATGGYWSAYWFAGHIYGTEIIRGLDVLTLEPSEFLSAHEIAAAQLQLPELVFNPQQQFEVSWPADPVVARAHLDQLERAHHLSAQARSVWDALLDQVDVVLANGSGDVALAEQLVEQGAALASALGRVSGVGERAVIGLQTAVNQLATRLNQSVH